MTKLENVQAVELLMMNAAASVFHEQVYSWSIIIESWTEIFEGQEANASRVLEKLDCLYEDLNHLSNTIDDMTKHLEGKHHES